MEYEWDDEKAADNFRKHGISFQEAAYALGDPLLMEGLDDRFDYGEERYVAIAMGVNSLLTIVYTERSDIVRIISAREATRHEQDIYYRQNST